MTRSSKFKPSSSPLNENTVGNLGEGHDMIETSGSSRWNKFRSTAERTIGQLAKSSHSPALQLPVSSTPTGLSAISLNEENWPGPFATAHEMIARREEVKRLREEAITRNNEGNAMNLEVDNIDEYDKLVVNIAQRPIPEEEDSNIFCISKVLTLKEICLEYLIDNFDSILDLGDLPIDLREELGNKLGSIRRLTHDAALALCSRSLGALSLTECSSLSEDTIVQALEKMCASDINSSDLDVNAKQKKKRKHAADESGDDDITRKFTGTLQALQLKNCGSCFGDRAALTLAHIGDSVTGPGLEDLALSGLYRLSDSCLSQLLFRCPFLRTLDLSCNNRLGRIGIEAIASSCPLLTQLRLCACAQLTAEDLEPLVLKPLPELRQVFLEQLSLLTDDWMDRMLEGQGHKMTHLSIKECSGLTDRTAFALRRHCCCLEFLCISGLAFSTPALLGLFVTQDHDHGGGPSGGGEAASETPLPTVPAVDYYRSLGRLRAVDVSNMEGMTDDVVIELSSANCDTLSDLNIGSCGRITDRALAALILHSRDQIERLNISFLRKISENVLCALLREAPRLKRMEVWGCTQLTRAFHRDVKRKLDVRIFGTVPSLI